MPSCPRVLRRCSMAICVAITSSARIRQWAREDTPPVLTFIDWQLLHAGPPGPESTQAWQYSLEPEVAPQG